MNYNHLIKYLSQFIFVTFTTYHYSPCNNNINFSMTLGALSATIFVILDMYYPYVIVKQNNNYII